MLSEQCRLTLQLEKYKYLDLKNSARRGIPSKAQIHHRIVYTLKENWFYLAKCIKLVRDSNVNQIS